MGAHGYYLDSHHHYYYDYSNIDCPIDLATGIEGAIPLNSNVTYKMGPDGQMIAIEKAPFSWKQLGIGAGIPSALLLLPLILLL